MPNRPTRSQLIGALVTDAVLQTRTKWNEYAERVVQHYHSTVALEDRDVDFHVATTAAATESATRLNTQTVRRHLSGEIRMSVDLEESLVAALPPAQRDRLLAALLDRAGLLLAYRPAVDLSLSAQIAAPCELLRSTATAVERVAPMLANGNGIGPEDAPYFSAAMQSINRVMGVCLTLEAQIDAAMQPAKYGEVR